MSLKSVKKEFAKYYFVHILLSLVHCLICKLMTGQIISPQGFIDNPMVLIDTGLFVLWYLVLKNNVHNKKWLAATFIVFFISQMSYYANLFLLDLILTLTTYWMMFTLAKSEVKIYNFCKNESLNNLTYLNPRG